MLLYTHESFANCNAPLKESVVIFVCPTVPSTVLP